MRTSSTRAAITFCELGDSADFSDFCESLFFGLNKCRRPFAEVWDGVAIGIERSDGVRLRYRTAKARGDVWVPLYLVK